MATGSQTLLDRLTELRESFDRAFSYPASDASRDLLELLVIRIGRERYALRLSEIAALEADRTITSVPSEHAELLGIAGVRGAVVAVFDLASLLDLPRPDGVRWLVLAKGAPLALAFSGFEGQRSVAFDALAEQDAGQAGRVRALVRLDAGEGDVVALPLIDIQALVQALERRVRARGEHAFRVG